MCLCRCGCRRCLLAPHPGDRKTRHEERDKQQHCDETSAIGKPYCGVHHCPFHSWRYGEGPDWARVSREVISTRVTPSLHGSSHGGARLIAAASTRRIRRWSSPRCELAGQGGGAAYRVKLSPPRWGECYTPGRSPTQTDESRKCDCAGQSIAARRPEAPPP